MGVAEKDMDPKPYGPILDRAEQLYRAIHPSQWVQAESRPSSAAFKNKKFSVDCASLATPNDTFYRLADCAAVAEFNCGLACDLGFVVHDEKEERDANNPAHAHVYNLGTNRERNDRAGDLAKLCTIPLRK
jgi:hypothetical protein